MPRFSAPMAIVGVVLATSRTAFGFPSSRLTYTRAAGAESCPDETAVRRAVAARLGYDPFFPSADKAIVMRITRVREKLHASVELVDDKGIVRGIREFDAVADECDELIAAAALAISIAIDPTNPSILGAPPAREAVARPSDERSPASTPPSEKHVVASDASKTPSEASVPRTPLAEERDEANTRPSSEMSLAVRPGVAVSGALGTAPAAAVGFGAFLEVRQGTFSLALEGRFDLRASTSMREGGRVRTSLWVGSVLPCFHVRPFFLCAIGSLGSLRAEGLDLATSRINHTLYAGLGARVGLEVALTQRLFLRPQLDVVAALFPAELQVDGVARWTAPRYAAIAGIGVGGRFP
jgi:hypothetical protein